MKRNHFIASLLAIPAIPAIAVAVSADDCWHPFPSFLDGCTFETVELTPMRYTDKVKINIKQIAGIYNLPVHIINTMVV